MECPGNARAFQMEEDRMAGTRKYKANREDFGTIRQRANGRFQASYLADGQRFYGPLTYSTRTDARAWLEGVHTDMARGKWRSPKTVAVEIFGTYASTWVAQRLTGRGAPLRPRTRAEYERFLVKGLSTFAKDRLDAITPARVRTWHAKRTRDAGATAAAKEAQCLRAILNMAVGDEIIDRNPVPSQLCRTSTGKTYRPPTPEELAVLLDEINPEFRLAVILASVAGLRLSEWRALRRADFTLHEDGRYAVSITRQAQWVPGTGWVVGEPKSAAGVRVRLLPDFVTHEVERHLNEFTGEFPASLLWEPKRRSEFIHDSAFRDVWDPAREAAGVKGIVREHDLRHYALTGFAQTGATLAEIQAFGGHSTAVAAMRYQHAAADRLAELSNRVAPLPTRKPSKVVPITG